MRLRNKSLFKWSWSHDQDGHHVSIRYKPLKIVSGTSRPMTFELVIQYWGLELYKAFSNDDPGLALTYFTARSNLLPNAFVWEIARFYRNYCSL